MDEFKEIAMMQRRKMQFLNQSTCEPEKYKYKTQHSKNSKHLLKHMLLEKERYMPYVY